MEQWTCSWLDGLLPHRDADAVAELDGAAAYWQLCLHTTQAGCSFKRMLRGALIKTSGLMKTGSLPKT